MSIAHILCIFNKKLLYISLLLLLLSTNSFAQKCNFKDYNLTEGSIDGTVFDIEQYSSGELFLSTDKGAYRFDGTVFEECLFDSISLGVITSSYKDNSGTIWFGKSNGEIFYFKDNTLSRLNYMSDSTDNKIGSIKGDENGNVFFMTQNKKVICYTVSSEVFVYETPNQLTAFYVVDENTILAGTFMGVSILHYDDNRKFINERKVEGLPYSRVNCIYKTPKDNRWLVGVEDDGILEVFIEEDNIQVTNIGEQVGLQYENVSTVLGDSHGNFWVGTLSNGLFTLKYESDTSYILNSVQSQFDKELRYIYSLYFDKDDNLWVGSGGYGAFRLLDHLFVNHTFNNDSLNNISAVTLFNDTLYLGSSKGVIVTNTTDISNFSTITNEQGLPKDIISSICVENKNRLWIGTAHNGVYIYEDERATPLPGFSGSLIRNRNVIKILEGDSSMYVATRDGLLVYNKNNLTYELYTTGQALHHNTIEDIVLNTKGQLLIVTRGQGLSLLTDTVVSEIDILDYEMPFKVACYSEIGEIWVGTHGSGVYNLFGENLTPSQPILKNNGLLTDFCYSIISEDDNYVWVGQRKGISRINTETYNVEIYGENIDFEGDCNQNAIAKSDNNKLYFGTTTGLLEYTSANKARLSDPPVPFVKNVTVNDEAVDFSDHIHLKNGKYRITIDFVGVDFRRPEEVSYEYMLDDGSDDTWTATPEKNITLNRLQPGEYDFRLRCVRVNGERSDEIEPFTIKIAPPLWQRGWFIALFFTLILVSIFFAIKIRERNQKLREEELEYELDIRTKEVRDQKDIVEKKNKDITDSINYAERIQRSILPSESRLTEFLSDSFIFFKPRDIVSGDFYWFDLIDKNTGIVVCADSTGHGVPGAFMSLIGTTLIKDIVTRGEMTDPADLLYALDSEINDTLNQSDDVSYRSNDGMDVTVCLINHEDSTIKVSSAMRPYILYLNGEAQYPRGSKCSVGGSLYSEKFFETHEYSVKKGDKLYLFSDGYADQFGGRNGKKFKVGNLRNMISDIVNEPMEVQKQKVEETFLDWKGATPQIDDVILMCLEF